MYLLIHRGASAMEKINLLSVILILVILFFSYSQIFMVFHLIKLTSFSVTNIVTSPRVQDSNVVEAETKRINIRDPPRKEDFFIPSKSQQVEKGTISCDRSHETYDICSMNGPTMLDPTTSTLFLMQPSKSASPILEKIRPYPRKSENYTMARIQEFTLTSSSGPQCQLRHNATALVFSAGGYTGNTFHDFNDGFIPLFITINSKFEEDQDFILAISKARDWWINKYIDLLRLITKNPIIALENDNTTHCFTSATIGLISHGFMKINPTLLPNQKTLFDFQSLLGRAFGNINGVSLRAKSNSSQKVRPRLVLLSRSGSVGRVILNEEEVKRVAEQIGFEVVVLEPNVMTPLSKVYELISTSHAVIGVHGAALTHLMFLRPGSVFMQVVPLGTRWVADLCFGDPAKEMGLEYMEYKIDIEESSLLDKYDRNDAVIKNPVTFRKDWSVMTIYLKKQNVKLNITRFTKYLKEAYKTTKKLMKI